MNNVVAICNIKKAEYPSMPPFNPPEYFQEYPFKGKGVDKSNYVYSGVRNIFYQLGMDKENYGTESWNPLKTIISPGDNVLIKPNFIRHFHGFGLALDFIITHGSIIRAIIDYVFIALDGKGSAIIGDAPIQQANFEMLLDLSGLKKVVEFYEENSCIKISTVDFRKEKAIKNRYGTILAKIKLEGDPLGYTIVDLGKRSELMEIRHKYKKFRVTNYDKKEMLLHHNRNKNEYFIANNVLNADVVINLPKLKTHRKAGMTCALKNMVGINGSKDWLPHHCVGPVCDGGDEYRYRSLRKRLITWLTEIIDNSKSLFLKNVIYLLRKMISFTRHFVPFKDDYFEGSWYGNDTIWRTILDINKILFFADRAGQIREKPQRKYFTIVDGIIGGEEEGPLEPNPKKCGVLIGGNNPLIIDAVCCKIMGFDYKKVPLLDNALKRDGFSDKLELDNVEIYVNEQKILFKHLEEKINFNFLPSHGWKNHIEISR